MSDATSMSSVIGPRHILAVWVSSFGVDRYSAAMERRPRGDAARDRHCLFWAIRHCPDYPPSRPEMARMLGFAGSVVDRCVRQYEQVTTPQEREAFRLRLRTIAGGTQR